jgi:hypothetical protein
VEAAALIDAPPRAVYALLADYRNGHPRILPRPPFEGLEVERGGTGAGTRIRVPTRNMGIARVLVMDVTEPEPGRVLMETEPATGMVTTFTVDPAEGGMHSQVTIATEWKPRGLGGLLERLFAPAMLRGVYAHELRNLQQAFRSPAPRPGGE